MSRQLSTDPTLVRFVQLQIFLCFIVWSSLFMGIVFAGEVTSRPQPHVGSIIGADGDAQVRFVTERKWLVAQVNQDLLTGDGLRTGSLGTLALLFADRTQIRVQSNSLLTVKSVAGSGQEKTTLLRLDRGRTWSRAVTGGSGVRIETPSATASIRGTDWSLSVDAKGTSQLIVLDGEVVLENKLGSVLVKRGEIAFAEIGKAPTKTILVNPKDREQQIYNISLVDAIRTFFKLTELKVAERRLKWDQIQMIPAAERNVSQWLELAEFACDIGDTAGAELALQSVKTDDAQLNGRANVVAGYLSFVNFDFDNALEKFKEAASTSTLAPNRLLSVLISRTASLLLLRRSEEAKTLIEKMGKKYGDVARFLLFKSILTAFSGDFPAAADDVRLLTQRFPDDPSFPAVEAQLSIMLDRPERARIAAENVLAIDPGFSVGFQVLGMYNDTYLGNSEAAVQFIRQGLSYNDLDSSLWGQLGYLYLMMGEYRKSEETLLKAINLAPNDIESLANYSILLLEQYRIDEASLILNKMEQLDPGRDFTMIFKGRLALQTDKIAEGQQNFLKATTLNPAYSDSTLGLAYAYYQQDELVQAHQALDNAARMNPNSPDIPLIGSVIASDRAHADQAIEYAREAIRLYRQRGGEGVTGLASTRGGNNTLGSAFSNLGLKAWANYYNELSFDPYSAESHFYRALQGNEEFSSIYQGLLLEPLAVSARNRFVDFFRRPFVDNEVGVSVGWPAEGTGYGGSADIQGFLQSPKPMSYYLSLRHDFSPEDRDNADKRLTGLVGAIGVNITPYDRLIFDINTASSTNGLPGAIYNPDPDNEKEDQIINGGLGYSHYFSARNIFLSRFMVQNGQETFSNEDPFGSTLSSLDYSLLYNFGKETADLLYKTGLKDITNPGNPNSPSLTVGGSGPFLENPIDAGLDTVPSSRYQTEIRAVLFNARHMFTAGSVDYTYGVELKPYRLSTDVDFLGFQQRDPGVGVITVQDGSIPFLYGDPVPQRLHIEQNILDGNGYADALWRLNKEIWFEGGMFVDYHDSDLDSTTIFLYPRVGMAWQVTSSDWFRLMFREDGDGSLLYSIAPVTTVGMVVDSELVAEGGRSTSYAARWDREWFTRFFTTLELRRQDIHDFTSNVPDSLMFFNAEEGRIDQVRLAANLWLQGGVGIFAQGIVRDASNRSEDVNQGSDLPLIPKQQVDAGITWIHPLQIRVNCVVHLLGDRQADVSGDTVLGSYETVDLSATWQPFNRHLELSLAATNLFDRTYELAAGMPAKGRHVTVRAAWRF